MKIIQNLEVNLRLENFYCHILYWIIKTNIKITIRFFLPDTTLTDEPVCHLVFFPYVYFIEFFLIPDSFV